ncbi:Gfo/Idh/MocA family protein [Gemmatimonadota bacterium]
MIKIAQIGVGYWGPNILRNLLLLRDRIEVKAVVDSAPDRLDFIHQKYPDLPLHDDYHQVLQSDDIDAVIIVTPAATHYQLASEFLAAGKHVLVEKPLATSVEDARSLMEIAENAGAILMVGHVFEYNAAVLKVEELINSNDLGEIYYIHGQRLNLGKVRQDVDVLWNLAPHDISIVNRWMKDDPVQIQAQGLYRLQNGIADAVFMHLAYADGRVCHLQCSWLDPLKVRRMTVIGSRKMVVYDDTSSNAKVQIFDKGIDRDHIDRNAGSFSNYGEFQLKQWAGDLTIPNISFREPLLVELEAFIHSIESNTPPTADGKSGLRVVKCLQAASESLVTGQPVSIER